MPTYSFTSLSAAARAVERDSKARQRRVEGAVKKAARVTARVVAKDLVPKAFGELSESIHVVDAINGSAVVADAPHAEAVELGSRPHMPPLDPIIRWVKLRGLQGITKKGNVVQNMSSSAGAQKLGSKAAAKSVGMSLAKQLEHNPKSMIAWRSRANMGAVDPATLAVAKAIQMSIAKQGTRPFRFMFAGITTAMAALDEFVRLALPDV